MTNVLDFGAAGDGVMDDTEAIQHALDDGEGLIEFPRGTYRISKTLLVDLQKRSRTAISGLGGVAKIIMAGPGPALFLKGTHASTARRSAAIFVRCVGSSPLSDSEQWQHTWFVHAYK